MEVARRIGGRDSHPDLHRVHADARPYATPTVESKRGGSRQGASARQVTDSRPRCSPAYLRSPGLMLASRMFRAGMKRPPPINAGVARRHETTGGQTGTTGEDHTKRGVAVTLPRPKERRTGLLFFVTDLLALQPPVRQHGRGEAVNGVLARLRIALLSPQGRRGVRQGGRSRPIPRPARVRRRRGNACTCAPTRTGMARCG